MRFQKNLSFTKKLNWASSKVFAYVWFQMFVKRKVAFQHIEEFDHSLSVVTIAELERATEGREGTNCSKCFWSKENEPEDKISWQFSVPSKEWISLEQASIPAGWKYVEHFPQSQVLIIIFKSKQCDILIQMLNSACWSWTRDSTRAEQSNFMENNNGANIKEYDRKFFYKIRFRTIPCMLS